MYSQKKDENLQNVIFPLKDSHKLIASPGSSFIFGHAISIKKIYSVVDPRVEYVWHNTFAISFDAKGINQSNTKNGLFPQTYEFLIDFCILYASVTHANKKLHAKHYFRFTFYIYQLWIFFQFKMYGHFMLNFIPNSIKTVYNIFNWLMEDKSIFIFSNFSEMHV